MSCIEYGVRIQGDVNSKLEKIVDAFAQHDEKVLKIAAGYFSTPEFIDYLKDATGKSNPVDINGNTLKKLLKDYFVARHNDVLNSVNKRNSEELKGFTSSKAKSIAREHTSNMLLDVYYAEASKPKEERLSHADMLKSVVKRANKTFNNDVADNLVKVLSSEPDKNKAAMPIISEINRINEDINNLFDEYDAIMDILDEADSSMDVTAHEERLDQIDELLDNLIIDRYVNYKNLIDKYGNVRQKNYSALISQLRGNPNDWFRYTLTSSGLINLSEQFTIVLENDKLLERNYVDENDVVNNDSEGIDEMAKSWEDSLYKSFDRHVSGDVKLYLSRLYKLSAPVNKGDNNYQFDDNNELGVPLTMGSNYAIAQISNYGAFTSVDDFIDSIYKVSRTNPDLYGFGKLVNDMLADRVLANKIFTQLAAPKIAKTIITIEENGIVIDQSNKSADAFTHMVYQLLNSSKNNYRTNFSLEDKPKIVNMIKSISNVKDARVFMKSESIKEANDFIYGMLHKYFPKIDKTAVTGYLYSDTANIKKTYTDMLSNISTLVTSIENTLDQPVGADADYSRLDAPIIELAKKLVNYSSIKNDLNSINAEGNLASDLIGNNYITNFVKQIHYGNVDDINAGLTRLKEFLTKSPQYEYSPFYFGVKDSKGKVIVPGIFNREPNGDITVNPNAKHMVNMSLFDGAKDRVNYKAAMYSGMSKGDYFLSQLVAFKQPVKYATQSQIGVPTAGFFMRTPSDAPKNFVLQAPKYDTDGLWSVVSSTRTAYIAKVQQGLAERFGIDSYEEYEDYQDTYITKSNNKNNVLDANAIYDMLKNPIDNKQYNNLYHVYNENTNKVDIPFTYRKGETTVTIWLEGDKALNTTNNVAENLEVKAMFTSELGVLPDDFLIDISETLTQDGILSGDIQRVVNRNNPAFIALNQQLKGELNNFVNNLNNVFEKKGGQWITKTKTDNLIDRAHYNGTIVEDGKLTGNFFKFIRLFQTNGLNVDSSFKDQLFLYGQDKENGIEPLLKRKGKTGLVLNTDRQDLIRVNDGRIQLNIGENTEAIINNLVEQWLNSYYMEVVDRTKQYDTIVGENFSTNDIVDWAVNNAIMEMNFDDIFEGDAKFYKSAQDFLKRTKEVQAAGKAYAGFNINDPIGGHIKNVEDADGASYPININGGIYKLPRRENGVVKPNQIVYARNGFHGVTIVNTVRPSENAPKIQQELIDILTPTVGKEEATRIAKDIAKGYFENTIANDAQSYITLDEFIARRHADGTLDEYQDLIRQLTDDTAISDIDLKGVNSRIQVQKNFYFDKQFDENTGTYYPRQIKNAEFVLIPKLIKGTDLEKLHDIMVANDVNQVNTVEASKAAKKNILTFWDNKGVANPEAFDASIKANNGIAVENYYYRYLYKQQEVPDHIRDEKNKAGIQIMKKIIDNASPEVQKHIDNFFSSYVANIKDDFNVLLTKMNWSVKDGKLVDNEAGLNADGEPILKFDEFYKKARVEAQRLGMDSNFIEYLTPDSLGDPKMPNYMNNVSSKLESIAQSIFNNGVTRQTLPGWHAAQVTSVGYGNGVLDENGNWQQLKYHPEVTDKDGNVIKEAYAEIMLPRWSSLIPKEYSTAQLSEEGLDIHLGYRIPTEGKQSISILKVVGFLDDVYGSTVIVPDEWVTQTGSDFDVDSIYAISYEMYKDKKGVVKKIEFDESTDDAGYTRRYIAHINTLLGKKVSKDSLSEEYLDEKVGKLYDSLKDLNTREQQSNNFKQLLAEENALYSQLSASHKGFVKSINDAFGKLNVVDKFDTIEAKFSELAEIEQDADTKELLQSFADYNGALSYAISFSKEVADRFLPEFRSAKKELISQLVADNKADYFNKVKQVAKEANLISFDDFIKLPIEEQNSRKARNNRILKAMIDIMEHPNSREENYSRSNFDDLTSAMKKMNDLRGASKVIRSSHNPLDQVDFMENAMSGAMLKAFSVTRDTFNSVNNYAKSSLAEKHAITVEYDLTQYRKSDILNAYPGADVKSKKGYAIVKHNRLANSSNNRNVVGKLLTVYSSQTTAHILDAVKEGTIFNENDYTFGTFKTLIDVGIDYETAVAFLMQPGITEIVNAYFETKSIYINATSNPINTAIRRIAERAGVDTNNATNEIIIKRLSTKGSIQNAYSELFGVNIDNRTSIESYKIPLNKALLENRLESSRNTGEKLSPEEIAKQTAFDLAMIFNFKKFNETTKNIEALARVSNPDRFGAKQTIRSTRKTLNNIVEYATNDDNEVGKTIISKGKPLIRALYPGIDVYYDENLNKDVVEYNIDVNDSAYPYLAAFLKYATLPSVEANSKLFPIESDRFNKITDSAQARLGISFTDEQYKEFKQYMVSNMYAGVPYLSSPLTTNKYGMIVLDNNAIAEQTENNNQYWSEEIGRIHGYDVTQSSSFKIEDINNPTEEELNTYNKLTPAQKVVWIQSNFDDGRGIFDFLDVNMHNQYEFKAKGFSSQSIRYSDQIDNVEELFIAFRDSFYNKNPLIQLASVDLIKYAFIAEGFKFKKGSISKIIPNDTMYSNIESKGMNIIQGVQDQFNTYNNPLENITQKALERFVRSHVEMVAEVNIPKPRKNKQGVENMGYKFNRSAVGEGVYFIPFNDSSKDLLEYFNIVEFSPKNYIRVSRSLEEGKRLSVLYRIVHMENGVYLMPLNPLERNEVSEYSVRASNNTYRAPEYYTALIDSAYENGTTISYITKDNERVEELTNLKDLFTIPKRKNKRIIEAVENRNEIIRLVNHGTPLEKAEIGKFINDVENYFSTPLEERGNYGVIRNDSAILKIIAPIKTPVIQNIPRGQDSVTVKISRINTYSAPYKKTMEVIRKGNPADITLVRPEHRNAVLNAIDGKSVNPNLYRIDIVTEEQIKEDFEKLNEEISNDIATRSDAITNIIEDVDIDVSFEYTETDKVAKDMFNEIYKRSFNESDKGANTFMRTMDITGVDRMSSVSINDNKRNIYTAASQYYATRSIALLTNINSFEASDGNKYSIDDPALYAHLSNHPEDYPLLLKVILDAKTFGEQFYDVFNLNLVGEDDATNKAIVSIRNSINNVRTNSKLSDAVKLLFNDYIANNFSTNPLIRHGLIELRTTFGDVDWFDLNFSDIGEINHKQIQTVVKYVNSILNEATKVIAPKAVQAFTNQYDSIMNSDGAFNFDNIITKEGKFINPYTDKFLEDRQSYIDAINDAKENYGDDSLEFIKAKLARDKWRAENVHQEVISDYYRKNNKLLDVVIKNAPKEYLEYTRLISELYGDNRTIGALTKEEKDRRREITDKIARLTSDFNDVGEMKDDEARYRAGKLKDYIENKRILNHEYFDYKENDGFADTLKYYLNIINKYEKSNFLKKQTMEDDYREAYDWVQTNTIYKLNDETNTKIFNAFKTLKSEDNNNSSKIKALVRKDEAYDDYGRIDPRKLSPESIAEIKKITSHKFSWTYDSNAGEAILIKEVPNGLPVLKSSFYQMLRGDGENDSGVNRERLAIIGKINQLISVGVDKYTGQISSKDLFENLTEDQLQELASLYGTLHTIKGNRKSKEARERFKNNVKFETNIAAFNREEAYAELNLKGTKLYNIWKNIFVQRDKDGNYVTEDENYVPNNDIFGYITPIDDTYIDKDKTEARNLIENDLDFVPTDYYYQALKEATDAGNYDAWFEANHVFNPYTHTLEPLKVWTTMKVNPNGNLKGTYDYIPTYENTERTVKDDYLNPSYKRGNTNYNADTGKYNNLVSLSSKERRMLDLLQNVINTNATSRSMKMFAERGFLPRRAKYEPDAKWYIGQAVGALGLEFRNTQEAKWSDQISYTKDAESDFDMMSLIKQKGYKERIKIERKDNSQTPEEYEAYVQAIREENKAIDAENLKLDNAVLDRDWRSVFQDFIDKATEYNAKERVKNTIYLLLEDLKETPAYKEGKFNRNLRKDNAKSTIDRTAYQTVPQENAYKVTENWARRILFNQFKETSPYSKYADLMQNITSAKYMIFNVTGGIANVATGMTNVAGEVFARDYFGSKDFGIAQQKYFASATTYLADMYKDKTNNLTVGISKLFDVVDFDNFTERRPNETATENVKRVRDSLYAMQSGGEHYMQNTVLHAMLQSHRLFKDTDGQNRVGSFANYIWEVEMQTMLNLLKSDENKMLNYKMFIKSVKDDLNELRKYDAFSKDFNKEFLKDLGDKKLTEDYIKARDEAVANAKKEFKNFPIAGEQFELIDGKVVVKQDSPLTDQMIGELRHKVISVNKKIHGVYDKIGAARIEKEWWGGLVMQYHKHIYPGIMKRYRTKGYYNESRNSIERGSYVSLANLLSTEFSGIGDKVKNRAETNNENIALASIKEVAKAAIDTVLNLKLNYKLMPLWEQRNMRRALGDLLGVTGAFLTAIAIHLMTDDDEIKESELLATTLYMADRLNSESSMYTPWGLWGEAGTLWSSPIAAQNGPKDLIKGLGVATSILFDEDYNPYYTTGLYKGQHKGAVLLYRNTPIYRVFQRLGNMTKNNNYYRINENAINIKYAKAIADSFDGE